MNVLSWYLTLWAGENKETPEKTLVGILVTRLNFEPRTSQVQFLEHYRYTFLLGDLCTAHVLLTRRI
jgi:hypothetical protein